MNWLRSGFNRTVAAIALTTIIMASVATCVNADTVKYAEGGTFLQLTDGQDWMCLARSTSYGYNVPGWHAVTCNDMNTSVKWEACWLKEGEPTFQCIKPE
jgi:hypothetical protein